MAGGDALSPFVYWGQSNTHIFLKVDIKEVEEPKIQLEDDRIDFSAIGVGMRGRNRYSFSIEFYYELNSANTNTKVTDRFIEFQIEKITKKEQWPRLTYSNQKPAWLKIDFDHFAFEDESASSSDEEYTSKEEAVLKKLEKDFGKDVPELAVDFKLVYLMFFNLFQWVGFCYVFLAIILHYIRSGEESKKHVFENVGHQLMVVQAAAILEVIHPLFGWVRSGVLMPFMQVFGRCMVLFLLIVPEPAMHDREPVWWLFVVWTSVELVRYPFYMLNLVSIEVPIVTWLRYTIWIPLYPLGFILEGFAMLLALPYVEKNGRWSVALPNQYNIAFHFPTFLKIYMCGFLIGGYFLMIRMYEQRKKKFPPRSTVSAKTAKSKKA